MTTAMASTRIWRTTTRKENNRATVRPRIIRMHSCLAPLLPNRLKHFQLFVVKYWNVFRLAKFQASNLHTKGRERERERKLVNTMMILKSGHWAEIKPNLTVVLFFILKSKFIRTPIPFVWSGCAKMVCASVRACIDFIVIGYLRFAHHIPNIFIGTQRKKNQTKQSESVISTRKKIRNREHASAPAHSSVQQNHLSFEWIYRATMLIWSIAKANKTKLTTRNHKYKAAHYHYYYLISTCCAANHTHTLTHFESEMLALAVLPTFAHLIRCNWKMKNYPDLIGWTDTHLSSVAYRNIFFIKSMMHCRFSMPRNAHNYNDEQKNNIEFVPRKRSICCPFSDFALAIKANDSEQNEFYDCFIEFSYIFACECIF